jgi:polyketide synthase-associated protein
LDEWVSPSAEEGGADLASLMPVEEFRAGLLHCLTSKGYCVVQTFDADAYKRQADKEVKNLRQGYKRLSAEEAEIVLGTQNVTKALELDPNELEKEMCTALEAADGYLNDFMMSNMAPVADFLGMEAWGCSKPMLRLPMTSNESTSLLPKPLSDTSGIPDFISWLARRHLCVIHCMEIDGGNLALYPQSEDVPFSSAVIPLTGNRIIIFRNECLAYSYQPEGYSLAIQAWLLAQPRVFEVRSHERPPRIHTAKEHIMSCMERFPIGCYGADMVDNLCCWY